MKNFKRTRTIFDNNCNILMKHNIYFSIDASNNSRPFILKEYMQTELKRTRILFDYDCNILMKHDIHFTIDAYNNSRPFIIKEHVKKNMCSL